MYEISKENIEVIKENESKNSKENVEDEKVKNLKLFIESSEKDLKKIPGEIKKLSKLSDKDEIEIKVSELNLLVKKINVNFKKIKKELDIK